jgi:hypothetical protein
MGKKMDLKTELKVGDKIISLETGIVYPIKYFVGNLPVVFNGVFDFPLRDFAPYSPLMEELV